MSSSCGLDGLRLRLDMGAGFVDGVEDSRGDGFDDRARCTATRRAQSSLHGSVVRVKGERSY